MGAEKDNVVKAKKHVLETLHHSNTKSNASRSCDKEHPCWMVDETKYVGVAGTNRKHIHPLKVPAEATYE